MGLEPELNKKGDRLHNTEDVTDLTHRILVLVLPVDEDAAEVAAQQLADGVPQQGVVHLDTRGEIGPMDVNGIG